MRVGVLALQGDVPEHTRALVEAAPGAHPLEVRRPSDLERSDALLLPGGESTTIASLLQESGLWDPLAERLRDDFPVLATCAGLIVLARRLEPSAAGRDPPTLGTFDVEVRRNDHGRQRESFEGPVAVEGLEGGPYPGVFIRSPRILSVAGPTRPIAWRGPEVVGVARGRAWGLTFHPELTEDPRLHRAFLASARGPRSSPA